MDSLIFGFKLATQLAHELKKYDGHLRSEQTADEDVRRSILLEEETYHRCFVKDRKTQIEDRDEKVGDLEKERALIISYINNTIPAEDRPYFTERVCYENEESLRKRLTMLFNLTPPKLMSHLFGNISSKEKKSIINKIVDTRNYYTHRDSKTKYPHVINSNGELYALIDKLSVLLQFFCLSHIGIDADVVERRLIEHM